MRKIIITISLFILLTSCASVDDGIEGVWSIDKCLINNREYSFAGNLMRFKNGKCNLPLVYKDDTTLYGKSSLIDTGNWKIIKEPRKYVLEIITNNQLFAGKYEISFSKDEENRLLRINLKNDKINLQGAKFLVNYDEEKMNIEHLESITN